MRIEAKKRRSLMLLPVLLAALLLSASCSEISAANERVTTVTFDVDGMSCAGCENSIKTEVGNLKGVTNCTADHKSGHAVVTYNPKHIDTELIGDAIVNLGYKVTGSQ